jgi:hydrogenase nickel incorporation protein HypA/HybF
VVAVHELSIARSMLDVAVEQLDAAGVDFAATRVAKVSARVGVMSGVVPEALVSAFEIAAIGTPLAGAVLQVQTVGLAVWCDPCQAERELPPIGSLRCPVCQSRTPKIVRGQELELTAMEVVND